VTRTSLGLATLAFVVVGLAGAAPVRAQDLIVPKFAEETQSAGIDSVYAGDWQYMVGGGVAAFDCNGDGYPDMLLAGGEVPAKFYRNVGTRGGPLKFTEQKSGLELDSVTGAYPIDIDGDGVTDIALLRVGETVLMRGLGGCKFERANEEWGFKGGDEWWTAFSATWERGATWPTLAIGSYINRTADIEPWGSCTENWLERPKLDGSKTQRQFDSPLVLKPGYCTLSMLFTDWNRSGTPSLRVSNDREYYRGGSEQLWRVNAGEAPTLYSDKDGWKNLKIWGMGIASADVNGDGYPDYFLTSMADNKLQTFTAPPQNGEARPDYKDVAFSLNAIAQHPYVGGDVRPSTAWHAQFEDVNNDGLVDLFIAKGNVSTMPDFAANDPNNLLLQGADRKFTEVGDKAGVASMMVSRGGALPDFNLDGLPDLVVVNRWTTAQVWRNTTPNAGHWLSVELKDEGANRDAIGSWIEVRKGDTIVRREVTVGGGHASGQLTWWHFGLGDATKAEVRVAWAGGTPSDWQQVDGDNFYILSPSKAPELWLPAKAAAQ
jgi:hypothetical protein